MTTDTKLRLHNITSKASLCFRSENWIINRRDAQKLEAARIRFLRPLLRHTRLDRPRNSTVEDIQLCQKKWLDHLKRTDKSRLPRLAFQYQPRGRRDMGRPKRR
jgi:hypothetical protein